MVRAAGARTSDAMEQSFRDFNRRAHHFLSEVLALLASRGTPLCYVPQIGAQPVDLCRLYAEVTNRGGYDEIREWMDVANAIGVPLATENLVYELRTCYQSVLLPYEQANFQKQATTSS
jgi:hypothetical protein